MTSVRLRTCIAGGAVAVIAGLLVDHGAFLGSALPKTALLGVLVGAVLGLVPDHSVLGRTGGFLCGFGAAWFGYALRAAVLPDIPAGRAIAAVVVIGVITLIATATAGRLPLWAGFVGAGALVGAYEATFAATPTAFLGDSATAMTTMLVAGALGLLVATVAEDLLGAEEDEKRIYGAVALPSPRASVDASVEQEAQR